MDKEMEISSEEQGNSPQQTARGSLPFHGIMGFLKWVQAEGFIWHGNHGRWLRGDHWPPKSSDFLTDKELFEQWFGRQ